MIPKSVKELEELINNSIEESFNLEYKSAESLKDTNRRNSEIAKDVSAMANSAGGILIYGIKEFDSKDKKHLPEKLSPINRKDFSREQLDQIITANISPKIEGLRIHPISVNGKDDVVYVVEIPQSNTAHQNTKDKIYYKRHNFKSEAMLDYEIRDIMYRQKHPIIDLDFSIFREYDEVEFEEEFSTQDSEKEFDFVFNLHISTMNKGTILAEYVVCKIEIPSDLILCSREDKFGFETFSFNNISNNTRIPVLPGLSGPSYKIQLTGYSISNKINQKIEWKVGADNAITRTGYIDLADIPYHDVEEQL